MPSIPVTIVTGFLGAGKTTLLNNVLAEVGKHQKIAVIENEYAAEVGIESGKVSSDGASGATVTEVCEFRELVGGCVCCSVRPALILALADIASSPHAYSHVIIETTGLANPQPVANVLFSKDDGLAEAFQLNCVVTVVDASTISGQLAETKPTGVDNEAAVQLALADVVIVNKTDLVSPATAAEVQAQMASVTGGKPILATTHGAVDVEALLSGRLGKFDLTAAVSSHPDFLSVVHHRHDESISSVAVVEPRPVDRPKFMSLLGTLASTFAPPDSFPSAAQQTAEDGGAGGSGEADRDGDGDGDGDGGQIGTGLVDGEVGSTPGAGAGAAGAADAPRRDGPTQVLRMKAEILFADEPSTRHVMQGVGGRFSVNVEGSWDSSSTPSTRLVLIGRGLDVETCEKMVADCVARPACGEKTEA